MTILLLYILPMISVGFAAFALGYTIGRRDGHNEADYDPIEEHIESLHKMLDNQTQL